MFCNLCSLFPDLSELVRCPLHQDRETTKIDLSLI
jgi:hypothetical protein